MCDPLIGEVLVVELRIIDCCSLSACRDGSRLEFPVQASVPTAAGCLLLRGGAVLHTAARGWRGCCVAWQHVAAHLRGMEFAGLCHAYGSMSDSGCVPLSLKSFS